MVSSHKRNVWLYRERLRGVNVFLSFLLCDLSAESAACLSLCIEGNQKTSDTSKVCLAQIRILLIGCVSASVTAIAQKHLYSNLHSSYIKKNTVCIRLYVVETMSIFPSLWIIVQYSLLTCHCLSSTEAHTCFQESLMPLNFSLKVNIADSGLKIARGGETSMQFSPALHLCADAFFPTVSVL